MVENKIEAYAPVVLFVYNRLSHVKETVEALVKNSEAIYTDLYVFSDGKKNENDIGVEQVREYISCIQGFKSVSICESEQNKGLASSIIDGVTEVINRHGRVIVLEDDIVVTSFFLDYMNKSLELYSGSSRIFGITSYNEYHRRMSTFPESFLLKITHCWGWATWKDKWDKFDVNATGWEKLKDNKKLRYDFDYFGTIGSSSMLINQMEKDIDSWAVRWEWSVYKNGGLFLFPKYSLCRNIGVDGSGVHCGIEDRKVLLADTYIKEYPERDIYDKKIEKKYVKHLKLSYIGWKLSRVRFYFTHLDKLLCYLKR